MAMSKESDPKMTPVAAVAGTALALYFAACVASSVDEIGSAAVNIFKGVPAAQAQDRQPG